jgi:hypothetical protein
MQALVLATESGIPYTSPLAKLAVPIGLIIFLGGPYLLLRSNLGTRRGYLVMATSFFGLMVIFSLFWGFGAPGTPEFTGPTNLPGQVADEYRPVWISFAEDSVVAGEEPYASLIASEAFSEDVPDASAEIVQTGVDDIKEFFVTEDGGGQIGESWVVSEGPFYAEADNGQPVIRVTYAETFQLTAEGELPEGAESEEQIGEVNPDGGTFTAYAFFDAGNPIFPSLVFLTVSVLAFALHAFLLHRDEQKERRASREIVTDERERVPAGSSAVS